MFRSSIFCVSSSFVSDKSRLVVVLPTQLGLLPGAEGPVGELRGIHTDSPSFVMATEEVDLLYLSINMAFF